MNLLIFLVLMGPPEESLDLAGWIALAMENSPEITLSEASEDQADASYNTARSALLPSLNATASAGRSWTEDQNGSFSTDGSTVSGGISLSVPLLSSGGSDWVALSAASLGREIASLDARASELALQQSVASAYYRALGASLSLEVARGALERDSMVLKRTEVLRDLEAASAADLLAARVQETQSRMDLVTIQAEFQNGMDELRRTAGIPGDSLFSADPDGAPLPLDSAGIALLPSSIEGNPSLLSAGLSLEIAGKEVESVSRTRLPSLSADGSVSWSGTGGLPGEIDGSGTIQAGLSLSVPIFDSGLTSARIQSARSSMLSAEASYQSERNSIETELRTSLRNLAAAAENVELARISLEYRETMLELSGVQYRQGSIPLDELIDAQNDVTEAEYQLVSAETDCLEREAEYMVLCGYDVRSGARDEEE